MLEYEYEWGSLSSPVIITFEYEYDPGEPDQLYDQYGNPGTPGYGPSIQIYHAWTSVKDRQGNPIEVDILDMFDSVESIDGLEELILEDNHE